MSSQLELPSQTDSELAWHRCRFLTCSVLPVRMACNCHCPFCFSKSSISTLKDDAVDWNDFDVDWYYEFAVSKGATRLVITGGGEPLLRVEATIELIKQGRKFFEEIALFTNGALLTREISQALREAGLSYVCYSRHHDDDTRCRELMGRASPRLADFIAAADGLPIRATCVMTRGWIDSPEAVDRYLQRLSDYGVQQFTFKHTYVAYPESLYDGSDANEWSRQHQIESNPFTNRGEIIGSLPWGPVIQQIDSLQVCYYFEPTPTWELENQLCRSINLLSNGKVYASLEDQRSQLFLLSSLPMR